MGVGQSLSPPYMVLPEDADTFFCMCAFSLEVAQAFFPWNGSFSLKQRKIIAFQKPVEILHKWILHVYIRTIVLCSWTGAIKKNQQSSKVSMAPTSSSGRMTVVGMLLAGSNMHQPSPRSTTRDVRLATTLRFGFKVLYVLQPFKDPHAVHTLLTHPDCQALTKFKEFPAYGCWANACKMCKNKTW